MRKLFGLLILCLTVMLGGCGMDPIDPVATDPTHIYEEVREDFLIDAEVISFPGNGSVTVYEATPRLLTRDQVIDFLAANGDCATEWLEHDPEYADGYICNTALGGKFWGGTSPTGLFPGDLSYNTSQDDRWGNCSIYSSQAHYDDNAEYVFADLFMEPKDFAFASANEADAKVRDMLAILGLNDLILNRTLYIDHETLANEVTPVLRTEEWQSAQKTGYHPTYDDWSETDDGYIFEYYLCVDNVPLFSRYVDMSTLAYQGDTIRVWYQASGIVKLEALASLWNIGEQVTATAEHISAEEALSIARIRLENTKTYANTTVYKLSSEYFYIMDKDCFLMRPVWVVYAKATSTYGFDSTEYIVIDAITGDEIV